MPGRENGYILGALASKDFTGKYFDQEMTWSWLLGSRVDGRVVFAYFNPDGSLHADWRWVDPKVPSQNGGWRFEEVKKT